MFPVLKRGTQRDAQTTGVKYFQSENLIVFFACSTLFLTNEPLFTIALTNSR